MPVKVKVLIEEQGCERCANLGLKETDPRCERCVKQITFSGFRPDKKDTMRQKMKDPAYKQMIKDLAKEG